MTQQQERQYVLTCFEHWVKKYSGKRMALYGLSANTEYLVKNQMIGNVVALLDGTVHGGYRWGLPVLSLDEARKMIDMIVIVARRQTVPLIYQRIASLESDGIMIVDVLGRRPAVIAEPFSQIEKGLRNEIDGLIWNLIIDCIGKKEQTLIQPRITDAFSLGYYSYGPLVVGYLQSLIYQAKNNFYENILFLGRDGYVLEKAYFLIQKYYPQLKSIKGWYILSSRRCLAGACIFDEQDILEQLKRVPADTSAGDILRERFHIEPDHDDWKADHILSGRELQEFFIGYQGQILQQSKLEREHYFQYLDKLEVNWKFGKNVLFDSLTVGTSAYLYRKLTKTETPLYAMVLLNITDYSLFDEDKDTAYLGQDYDITAEKAYTRNEFLNDSIFSAPTPQLICFKEGGIPEFSTKDDNDYYKGIEEVHEGILRFVEQFLEKSKNLFWEQEITPEFLDALVGTCMNGQVIIDEDVKKRFYVVEQFSGKMGKIPAFAEDKKR